MHSVIMRTMMRVNGNRMQEQRSVSNAMSRGKRQNLSQKWPILLMMLAPVCVMVLLISFFGFYNSLIDRENAAAGALSQEFAAAAGNLARSLDKSNLRQKKMKPSLSIEEEQHQHLKENMAVKPLLQQNEKDVRPREILVLTTTFGDIRIVLRRDLSSDSVDYIHRLIESGQCKRCSFHRAEQHGILQGVMANRPDVPLNEVLGPCPKEFENLKNNCPPHDSNCGCHGPIMTRGSVGWAAGSAGGPDFFISAYKRPAKWWGTQHTNFGFIEDQFSMNVVDRVFQEPTHVSGGLSMLVQQLPFTMKIENEVSAVQ